MTPSQNGSRVAGLKLLADELRTPQRGEYNESRPLHEWRARYDNVRRQTLKLVETLTPEDQMVQSMPEASPAKWHLAHTTWFFETFVLSPHETDYAVFDERYRFLFNSYYKRLGDHPNRSIRGTFSRPALNEVSEYRTFVDKCIRQLLDHAASNETLRLLELGLHHEQQHQELIVTDIKHAFWTNPLRPSYQSGRVPVTGFTTTSQPLTWYHFDEGVYEIGHDKYGFAFDNEMPLHPAYLQPFSIASRLVTNQEYLAFIADGGYKRPELWLSDGWDQVCGSGWIAPLYWERAEDDWVQFTCQGMAPLNPGEPVCHLSFYEADAFARWAGARLPTEFEWEVAAGSASGAATMDGNLLEDARYHPCPARRLEEFASRHSAALWGHLGVDVEPVHRLSGLSPVSRRRR